MSRTLLNIKNSARNLKAFKLSFPMATFYGNTTLGKSGKSYHIPTDIYDQRKEDIKRYGSKARDQPKHLSE